MERNDADGTWTSTDGGRTWLLTAPSEAWLNRTPPSEPAGPTAEERIAELEAVIAALLEETP